MYGAFGVVSALKERHLTGRGRVVRTSLLAAIVGVHAFQGTRYTVAGEVPSAIGNHHPSIAPYGLFRTSDSPVQIAIGSEELWSRFASVLGLDATDHRFASNEMRVAHRQDLNGEVERILETDGAEGWLARLAEAGVPAGKVRTLDEVYAWEQTESQGLLIEVEHASVGRMTLPGPPLRFDDNSYAGSRRHHLPPPRHGEHDESVRTWLREVESSSDGPTCGLT
jgi:crotonobetainyl-CoA:carnitine CoA-transferase CaiB-like acyl-CoA transferase